MVKSKYSSKLNRIENKLNYKESDEFVNHVYLRLVLTDMSDEKLSELINIGESELENMHKEIDDLINLKKKLIKFNEIDKKLVAGLRKNFI